MRFNLDREEYAFRQKASHEDALNFLIQQACVDKTDENLDYWFEYFCTANEFVDHYLNDFEIYKDDKLELVNLLDEVIQKEMAKVNYKREDYD